MKTERRHELQTNDLASWLTGAVERTKPYASTMFAGLAVVVLIGIVTTLYYQRERVRQKEAWGSYFAAMYSPPIDVEELEATATTYSGLSVADMARLKIADQKLSSGLEMLLQSRSEAMRLLLEAEADYQRLYESARHTLLRDRAAYSLATALESQGKITEAIEQYQQVEGALSLLAQSQARRLGNEGPDKEDLKKLSEAQELYDWLSKVKPPSDLPAGAPGIPGLEPLFDIDGPSDVPYTGEPADDFLDKPLDNLDALQLDGLNTGASDTSTTPDPGTDDASSEAN